MLNSPVVATFNHLLAQSGWALPRLARFSGCTARIRSTPFSLTFTVQGDGLVHAAPQGATADAELTIPPTLLPRLALREERAYALIETSGDASLIEELVFLARNLRWDMAEDISRVTGDIAAERIAGLARSARNHLRDTALNLSHALVEYWTEERPAIAKPQSVAGFSRQVTVLRDEVAQLERRIERLGRGS